MASFGDVVLVSVQFPDTYAVKNRPVLVLFEDEGVLVVAGVTGKLKAKGVYIYRKDGATRDCVIRTNYVFTISPNMVRKKLFTLPKDKQQLVLAEFTKRMKVAA